MIAPALFPTLTSGPLELRLVNLSPEWIDHWPDHPLGRRGVGMRFRCPRGHWNENGEWKHWFEVYFENPLDGKGRGEHAALLPKRRVWWHRTGDEFGLMTLDKTVRVFDRCGGRMRLTRGVFHPTESQTKSVILLPPRKTIILQP